MKKIMLFSALCAFSVTLAGPSEDQDLHLAIANLKLDDVKKALENGADPNALEYGGGTPLTELIMKANFKSPFKFRGTLDLMQELLNNPKSKDRIDVNKKGVQRDNSMGSSQRLEKTPLEFLAWRSVQNHEENDRKQQLINLLKQHGAK